MGPVLGYNLHGCYAAVPDELHELVAGLAQVAAATNALPARANGL